MGAEPGGIDPCLSAVERINGLGRARSGIGAQLALLSALVVADQVGCDPVEPRASVGAREVEAVAPLERGEKGLGSELVGERDADPLAQVGMDPLEVAIEDLGELRRRLQRSCNRRAICCGGVYVPNCPMTAGRFPRKRGRMGRWADPQSKMSRAISAG